MEDASSNRKRKFHPKSRRGCLQCKARRVKCDEQLPTCSACKKRNQTCKREDSPAPVSRTVAFRRFVNAKASQVALPTPQSPLAPTVSDPIAHAALEYFYLRTLPVLRICQPSILWDAMATTLAHRDEPIRNIAIALGFAQRLECESTPNRGGHGQPLAHQAVVLHTAALRSLRTCMGPDSTKDCVLHAFASLLLVILESLWKAPSAMLMHLRSGLQIIKTAEVSSLSSLKTVNREITRLLERYRVSSSLYGLLAVPNNELAELDTRTTPSSISEANATAEIGFQSLASQQYQVIEGSIQVWRGISGTRLQAEEHHTPLQEQLSRLQVQHASLQDRLLQNSAPEQASHLDQFAQAQMQLTSLALRSASASSHDTPEREDESLGPILDTLESALYKFRSLQEDPGPFSVGLGVLSVLGVIALMCHDAQIRERALTLLTQCPKREGLWDAVEMRQMIERNAVGSSQSTVRQGSTFNQIALQRIHSVFEM